jgi:flagellar hook-associated protein 1 FlgK
MGNLLTSLVNTADALGVYSQALQTTENNVVNASTPGYARQVQTLLALPFDLAVGFPGGVGAGPVQDTRSAFAEQSVRAQQSQLGYQKQIATSLGQLQSYFDISGSSNIPTSLDGLFSAFSQLSVNPNDTASRQAVLTAAQQVALSFQHTASGVASLGATVDDQTRVSVDAINRLAGRIAQTNLQRANNASSRMDAGVDANLNNDLEELSQYADFKALQQPDGSVTVYLGGQTPLVLGDTADALKADFSTPRTKILDAQGKDITSQIHMGSLAGMLDVKNNKLPSYLTGLNKLAQSVADQVNTTLSNGVDQNGVTPATDLFATNPAFGAAVTLSVNPLTPDQIAAALPDAPGGNGNALALAQLSEAKGIQGSSLTQFYGGLAGSVGRDISNATDASSTDQLLLTQAQSLRSQLSGVSLDHEATELIGFERAYQATAKMLSILNDLTGTVINIIP